MIARRPAQAAVERGGSDAPTDPRAPRAGPAGASTSGLVTLGESMALLGAPEVGRLRDMPHLRLSIAGAESNVAIAFCRLGGTASWIGRVGADEFGELILKTLRAERVVPVATVDPVAPTGLLVKERRLAQVTRVSYYRTGSAGSRLCSADLDEELIASAGVLHLTGITAALGAPALAALHDAVDIARSAAVPVSFDVNFRSKLWTRDEASPVLRAIAERSDVVFAGEEELGLLAELAGLDGARAVSGGGKRDVVVKRGARGASSLTAEGLREQAGFPVVALDPVGAGDAFVAGYLTERSRSGGAAACLQTACAAGAFAVTHAGDWEASPAPEDLELLGLDEGTALR